MKTSKKRKIICKKCKKTFYAYRKSNGKFQIYCSKKCEGLARRYDNTLEKWSGGHISKSTGYKYVLYNGKQVEEHRLVMMKKIGRKLLPNEHVHHINGNKLDNRVENLMLLTNKEHSSLHSKAKGNQRYCLKCGKYKLHHARGLCPTCYHAELMKKQLQKYELTKSK